MHTAITDWFPIAARADRPAAAIGDVHGRADLLEGMLAHLDHHLPSGAEIVLLGDLIDRGPESLRALDIAIAGVAGREVKAICGNHESMLLAALDVEHPTSLGAMIMWARNGGGTVLEELGIYESDPHALKAALSDERLMFLCNMETHVMNGTVLFVHGGVHPKRPIAPQLAQSIMDVIDMAEEDDSIRWVRWPWLGHNEPLEGGLFVVYGHSIQRAGVPLVTCCQAGIDMGAYNRGFLCAAEVVDDRIRYHFVGEYDRVTHAQDVITGIAVRRSVVTG